MACWVELASTPSIFLACLFILDFRLLLPLSHTLRLLSLLNLLFNALVADPVKALVDLDKVVELDRHLSST